MSHWVDRTRITSFSYLSLVVRSEECVLEPHCEYWVDVSGNAKKLEIKGARLKEFDVGERGFFIVFVKKCEHHQRTVHVIFLY